MNKIPIFFTAFILIPTSLFAGEAQMNFASKNAEHIASHDITEVIHEYEATDARFPYLNHHHSLVMPQAIRKKIHGIKSVNSLEEKKAALILLLKESSAYGKKAVAIEWQRLTPDQKKKYSNLYAEYPSAADAELKEVLQELDAVNSNRKLNRWIDLLLLDIENLQKKTGDTGRAILTLAAKPFVFGWIGYHIKTDDRSAHTADFDKATVYLPPSEEAGLADPHAALLNKFAPVFVVENNPSAPYAKEADRIGSIFLSGDTPDQVIPSADTSMPAVYSYSRIIPIKGNEVVQLVYVIWFPEHPAVKGKNDPEAGILEGWTIRITLNRNQDPILYESVSNCGCYYKIFPTQTAEDKAKEAFPDKLGEKLFYIENKVPNGIDATVPELIPAVDGNIAAFYEAGTHQLLTIGAYLQKEGYTETAYTHKPYSSLESLPYKDYQMSLFQPDGLVRHADRPECALLSATGMFHAGHPRQRSMQMIYFDQFSLDDPDLFETYLRVPDGLFD